MVGKGLHADHILAISTALAHKVVVKGCREPKKTVPQESRTTAPGARVALFCQLGRPFHFFMQSCTESARASFLRVVVKSPYAFRLKARPTALINRARADREQLSEKSTKDAPSQNSALVSSCCVVTPSNGKLFFGSRQNFTTTLWASAVREARVTGWHMARGR